MSDKIKKIETKKSDLEIAKETIEAEKKERQELCAKHIEQLLKANNCKIEIVGQFVNDKIVTQIKITAL